MFHSGEETGGALLFTSTMKLHRWNHDPMGAFFFDGMIRAAFALDRHPWDSIPDRKMNRKRQILSRMIKNLHRFQIPPHPR